jgi:hypothetical protein
VHQLVQYALATDPEAVRFWDALCKGQTPVLSTDVAVRIPNMSGVVFCPFHEDKIPSMHVSNGLYFCFACQRKGPTAELPELWGLKLRPQPDLSRCVGMAPFSPAAMLDLIGKSDRLAVRLWVGRKVAQDVLQMHTILNAYTNIEDRRKGLVGILYRVEVRQLPSTRMNPDSLLLVYDDEADVDLQPDWVPPVGNLLHVNRNYYKHEKHRIVYRTFAEMVLAVRGTLKDEAIWFEADPAKRTLGFASYAQSWHVTLTAIKKHEPDEHPFVQACARVVRDRSEGLYSGWHRLARILNGQEAMPDIA